MANGVPIVGLLYSIRKCFAFEHLLRYLRNSLRHNTRVLSSWFMANKHNTCHAYFDATQLLYIIWGKLGMDLFFR